jgi:pyridoxal phosphate enzyme (YggS family)
MLEQNIIALKQEIGQNVQLVVVSKFRTINEIQKAYNTGHRVFAENRVQALMERKEALPQDIEWHLIGHLQTNKVKFISPFIKCIQSVDSLKLLQEINQQALKNERIIDCLLQIYISHDETKFGLSREECLQLIESKEFKTMNNIRITGLMGMATLTEDENLIRSEFETIKALFDELKTKYFGEEFKHLSIGMSSDYKIAIACGSNMIRVGSSIFQ